MKILTIIVLFILLVLFTVFMTFVRYNLCKNSPCRALRETGVCPFADENGLPTIDCSTCPYMERVNEEKSTSV